MKDLSLPIFIEVRGCINCDVSKRYKEKSPDGVSSGGGGNDPLPARNEVECGVSYKKRIRASRRRPDHTNAAAAYRAASLLLVPIRCFWTGILYRPPKRPLLAQGTNKWLTGSDPGGLYRSCVRVLASGVLCWCPGVQPLAYLPAWFPRRRHTAVQPDPASHIPLYQIYGYCQVKIKILSVVLEKLSEAKKLGVPPTAGLLSRESSGGSARCGSTSRAHRRGRSGERPVRKDNG